MAPQDHNPPESLTHPAAADDEVLKQAVLALCVMAEEGYPYDQDKDKAFLRDLLADFPTLNLVEEIKQWRAWLMDNQERVKGKVKRINYRSRLRRWCTNASAWKVKNNNKPAQSRKRYVFEQQPKGKPSPKGHKVTEIW